VKWWAYYNEIEPYAGQWLRNLIDAGHIAPGDVDERSIEEVQPDDLKGYTQAHFFAGIGGWSYALRLAGWPDDRPAWTGSCPCQPFSSAIRGRAVAIDLWPQWARLIAHARPVAVVGEQVPDRRWLDRVCDDMEGMGYTVGALVLPACGVGQDHIRSRLYFAGHSDRNGKPVGPVHAKAPRLSRPRGNTANMATTHGIPNRLGQLRAYGNAIVPALAAEFVMAYMECRP
jgi:DNA (cytosine-5)-methyltransferase 1